MTHSKVLHHISVNEFIYFMTSLNEIIAKKWSAGPSTQPSPTSIFILSVEDKVSSSLFFCPHETEKKNGKKLPSSLNQLFKMTLFNGSIKRVSKFVTLNRSTLSRARSRILRRSSAFISKI